MELRGEQKRSVTPLEQKRKEKTTPFGVNLMRSQVLNRAAQALLCYLEAMLVAKPLVFSVHERLRDP